MTPHPPTAARRTLTTCCTRPARARSPRSGGSGSRSLDQEDPGHFIFVEEWPDRTALDAHCATEHFTRLVPQIDAHQRAADTYIQMRRVFPA
ncbi:MAG: putative quinol monooxygenase [Leucobacter sp.]